MRGPDKLLKRIPALKQGWGLQRVDDWNEQKLVLDIPDPATDYFAYAGLARRSEPDE
jgi:hypothetical protein